MVILAILFMVVPLADVFAVLQSVRPGYLFVALCISMLVQWLIAVRLRLVVRALGVDLSTGELFAINAATRFYGLFLPGGNLTGIAVRFYKMSGDSGQYAATAVTLVSERIIATLTLCLLGLVFWFLAPPAGSPWLALVMFAGLLATTFLFALLMGYVSLPFSIPVNQGGRLREGMGRIRAAVGVMQALSTRTLAEVFALSILIHLISVIAFMVIAFSLGMNVSFVTMGWIRSGLILATMIPISVSGVGLREFAALLLFEDFSNEEAVAFAFLVFIVTVLAFGLLGGLIEARRLLTR
ncbi:MAG: flippase-like domain-containing protein [Gammaproteobacteria bacterium]|nr:flippase-like domain-containing protein [Gammaproteobacteria bacterium]